MSALDDQYNRLFGLNPTILSAAEATHERKGAAKFRLTGLLALKTELEELDSYSEPLSIHEIEHNGLRLTAATRIIKGKLMVDGLKVNSHFLYIGAGEIPDPKLFKFEPVAALDFSKTVSDFDPDLLQSWPN